MAYVTYFDIIGAYADLALKQIIIETNFKVKESSLSFDNVIVYEINKDNNTHEISAPYSISLDETEKNIIIQFENYPENETVFYVIIKNLVDKLNRPLQNNFDRYISFIYNIKTKLKIKYPLDQSILKSNKVDFEVATSCEDDNIFYRIEFSHNVAFFKNEYIIFNEKEILSNSNNQLFDMIEHNVTKEKILFSINFKEDGQYYIRMRAEIKDEPPGKWSNLVTFSVTTAESPIVDNSGFLDDFLYSDVLYEVEYEELKILDSTKTATTPNEFYLEFNKDINFIENENSKYTEDGLLYIGKGYMTRRDL